jgi:hypothetical protein
LKTPVLIGRTVVLAIISLSIPDAAKAFFTAAASFDFFCLRSLEMRFLADLRFSG